MNFARRNTNIYLQSHARNIFNDVLMLLLNIDPTLIMQIANAYSYQTLLAIIQVNIFNNYS